MAVPDDDERAAEAVTAAATGEGATRDGAGGGTRAGAGTGDVLDSLASPGGLTTVDPLLAQLARTPSVSLRAKVAREGAQLGRFVVERVLGQGGMGVVLAAHDPTLDRKVAIKLLRTSDPGAAARARLVREAQAAARVEHDSIIAIHEVATVDDQVFVVMELVDGETLARWQRGRPWREVLAAYLRAGEGLAAAHAAGLVHRDFKPDNVLVGKDGRLRVTDFGLVAASGARLDDDGAPAADSQPPAAVQVPLTRTGDVMGTPAYMAPEQHRGEPADARADQFSFCVALWEGLYGLRPFDAGSPAERQQRIARGELAGPLAGRVVPARFDAILRRGLAAEPAARWPDMPTLLAALADDPDARRRARRRAALVAAGVVALAGGAAVVGARARGGGAAPPCQGLERALAGSWDPARRATVEAALVGTGKPHAADATARALAALDERAAALTARRIETCEATAVRRAQSPELLDRRMACLDRRQAELAATVEVLLADPAASLARAADAVLALPALDACDGERVLAVAPPPTDPAATAAIARARAELDRAAALGRAGRWKDAREPAQAAVAAATESGWAALVAEALAVAARARLVTGDPRGAAAALHEGIAAATTAGDAVLAARLTVALVEVANREARYGDVETLAALAEATVGGDDARWAERATLAAERGRAARAQQQLDVARGHLERALALRTTHAGADSLEVARTLNDLGNLELAAAQWRRAEELFQQALAIVERRSGPHHPDLALSLGRLAVAAKELGRLDESAAALRRSIEILTAAEGELSPSLATAWANLGVVLGAQDQGQASLAAYQKALAVREQVLPPDHPDLASTIMNVGIALQENLGRPADAVPYFERARDLLLGKLGPDHPTLAYALHGLGASRLALGDAAAAVAALEHAYRIRAGKDVDPGLRADTGYVLAKALWASGGPGTPARRRAVELATATRRAFAELGHPADPWLDAHGRAP
ncbi:MAG: serine/threonine-protein kinase [Myxococcales bacterium]|nr:serine/threonine-protein kinase [Myxococcales bacterium]